MATRNIVPRATGEGSIGTSAKTWGAVYTDDLAVTNTIVGNLTGNVTGNVTGDLTGNADTATNDGLGNNIANTYQPAVVGAVIAFAGSTSPAGWLLCDGSAVSRTTYANLFSVIGTTYGAGDGTDTFNLPNLVDKFVEGSATAGTEKSAGLPNITGSYRYREATGVDMHTGFSGAITGSGYVGENDGNLLNQTSTSSKKKLLTFNASNSNSIYGNSTTVQPPALTMRYIIKY